MGRGIAKLTFVLALAVLVTLPAWAGYVEQPRYFGPGTGYPDFGSASFFYRYYPPNRWGTYGYGTGHAGQGYGPYVYGGRIYEPSLEQRPDLSMPMIKPRLKWIGGNQVRVYAPGSPGRVRQMKVDVLAFNGEVIQTATVASPPYEIIAILPEGATTIRVNLGLCDGFSASAYPIIPVCDK